MSGLSLSTWQIVALLGAAQGVVLALALALSRTNRRAHRLLALVVLAFSIHLASTVYYSAGLVDEFPHLFAIGYPLGFLFGPLVYLYAACASDRSHRLSGRDLWHLVPFALSTLSVVPTYLLSAADKVALYRAIASGHVPLEIAVEDRLKLLSGLVYTVVTLRLLGTHQRVMADNYSSLERVNLDWLRRLSLSAAGIWGIAIAFELAELAGIPIPPVSDQLIAVALTVLIYGIGYMGLRQPEIFRFDTAEHPIPEPVIHTPLPMTVELAAGPSPRYERSGLGDREASRLKDQLLATMAEARPYRNPDLTLGDLADQLHTTPHKLSEVLNGLLEVSFYDFVNGYRIREVQQRLTAPDGTNLKVLSLALDAGFASKSTFNAAFKKHTGLTPSEYRVSTGV